MSSHLSSQIKPELWLCGRSNGGGLASGNSAPPTEPEAARQKARTFALSCTSLAVLHCCSICERAAPWLAADTTFPPLASVGSLSASSGRIDQRWQRERRRAASTLSRCSRTCARREAVNELAWRACREGRRPREEARTEKDGEGRRRTEKDGEGRGGKDTAPGCRRPVSP